jgi:hypothetical protein
MQFRKGPLRIHSIGSAYLRRDPLRAFALLLALPFSTPGALSNIGQVLQTDKRVRMLHDDLFGERVIGLQLQLSLSPGDLY